MSETVNGSVITPPYCRSNSSPTSGRWQARYRGPDERGHAAPSTFASKTDAGRWLSGVEIDIARGSWLAPEAAGVKLATYARAWIAERRVKGRPLATRTRETYEHSLEAWIVPYLGGGALGKITPAVIRTWHAEVSTNVGPTATRQAYALLRAVLSTAVIDGALPRNPCIIAGAGQATSPERPLLDIAQVNSLAAAMPAHLRAPVIVGFWAHLRLGELVGLERGDLDLDAGTLQVVRQVVETRRRSSRERAEGRESAHGSTCRCQQSRHCASTSQVRR